MTGTGPQGYRGTVVPPVPRPLCLARPAIRNGKMNSLVRGIWPVECSTGKPTLGVPTGTTVPLNGGTR